MALSNFTIVRNPFNNVLLTDSNTVWIDADTGSDTNNGTLDFPYKSLSNIVQPATNTTKYYVIRGSFTDGFNLYLSNGNINTYILGDLNTEVRGNVSITSAAASSFSVNTFLFSANVKYDTFIVNLTPYGTMQQFINFKNVEINVFNIGGTAANYVINTVNTFIATATVTTTTTHQGLTYMTFSRFNASAAQSSAMYNSIISDVVNFMAGTTIGTGFSLYNCIIRKQTKWYYNNVLIPVPDTTDVETMKTALSTWANNGGIASGTGRDSFNAHVNRFFGTGTIIYDDSAPNVRLFNIYDTVTDEVLDFSLNRQNGNPALFNSAFKSYVGAYRPKENVVFNDAVNISTNDAGSGMGDLLKKDAGDNIFIDLTSTQTRNRMEMQNIFAMLSGDAFTQWQSVFFSANTESVYLGAKQNLGAGQFPINAVLVTPYDTGSSPNPSAFPKFLAPLNKEVQMAYFIATGAPVLFNDLAGLDVPVITNKNLPEVGTWAVTNAVHEWSGLVQRADVVVRSPRFRYFKLTLIANKTQ